MADEPEIDWFRVFLLGLSSLFALISIIIRYWWKHSHSWVPQLPRNKKWPNFLIAFIQLVIFLVLVVGTTNWVVSDTSEHASDFHKMSSFVKGLESKLTSTDASLSRIQFPTHAQIMKAKLPEKLFEIEGRSSLLKKVNMVNLDEFEQWLEIAKCNESEIEELKELKELKNLKYSEIKDFKSSMQKSTIFNEPRSKWTDVVKELQNDADDKKILYEEKKKFDGHVSRTRSMIGRLSYIWENAEGFFRSGMLKSTETKNIWLLYTFTTPGVFSIFFSFWSIVCTIFFTQYQMNGYWVRLMKILFYLNAFQAIVMSGYELHTILAPNCNPIVADYGLYQFDIPTYDSQSTIKADDTFMTCIINRKELFTGSNNIIEASESNFTKGFTTKIKDRSTDVFTNVTLLDESVLKPRKQHNTTVELAKKVKAKCPNSTEFLQPVFDIDNGFASYKSFTRDENIDVMKDDSFDAPMQRMNDFINEPVRQFNNIMRGTNFDCHQHYDTYLHGYNWFCTAVNHVAIDFLKIAIIVCSSLLAVLHLFYLRRADNTQYWNDPRVRWAHKFMTDFVDDEQYREWLTTNNEDPPEATYYQFWRRKNRKRNRFSDVPLIDQSRVVLTDHVTDYIHASWIHIPGTNRRYIATQAPKPKTFKEFWAMIAQEKIKIIVMLTGFIELDNRICDLYFPFFVGETVKYGRRFQVTCIKLEKAPKSTGLWKTTRRTFELIDLKHPDAPPQIINHIFFKSWYVEVVPIGLERVVDLQRYIETLVEDDSPICVLDHSGIDRTGVYICIDYAHALIIQDRFISMVNVVDEIATMRWGVLSTFVAYLFVFASLTHRFIHENYLFFEDWELPLKKYRDTLLNRIGKQNTWRGNKQIQIQYWKDKEDPSWWSEK